jgi:hypothetical protein
MTKVCTHGRDAKVALRQLDESLRPCGPTISICGRFTSACTTTTLSVISHREAPSRRWSGRRSRARSDMSASPAIKIRRSMRVCCRQVSLRRMPTPAERLRRDVSQFSDARASRVGASADRRNRHEEPWRRRWRHQEKGRRRRRRDPICNESSRVHNGVGHRLIDGASSESQSRARFFADEYAGAERPTNEV